MDCKLIEGKHPDANTSGESWATSQKGKAWKAAGFDFCQFERRIDGSAHAFALSKPAKSFGGASSNKFDKRGANSKSKSDVLLYKRYDTLFVASTRSDITHTVPMKLLVPDTTSPLNVYCLIDTGALQSNYISNRTAAWLHATWDKERVLDDSDVCVACNNCKHSNNLDLNNTSLLNNKRKRASAATGDKQPSSLLSRSRVTRVCFGINGMCIDSPGEMVFSITFFNEVTGNDETWHNVVAKILDTPYDFILGLPDIRKHNMLNKVKSHFEDADKSDNLQEPSVVSKSEILPVAGPCSYTTNLETAPVVPTVNTIYTKEELLTPEVDDDDVIWVETE